MKLFYLILSCLLLDSSLVAAGLLDAIDDLLGTGGSQRPSRSRERPRYDFNSNERSDEESDRNNDNNGDNRRGGLLSDLLSNRPINNNSPNNGLINLNNLLPNNRPINTNNNILNGLVNNNNQEDQDKLVADAFPEGVALLDRLKELNKLKAEGKLNIGPTNNNNKNPINPFVTVTPKYPPVTPKPSIPTKRPYIPTAKPYIPTSKPYVPTPKPNIQTPKPNIQTPKPNDERSNEENNDNTTTEDSNAVEVKDFYFQAQPVVPDNEKNGTVSLYIVE